ncbi:MAG: A/G-specific adenine glycosylase [Hyphomicrobiaceae bacterium]|nr:A/G-specific adenine glycosylase [Hyphomicrobiaceae bacterium]
MSKTHAGTFPVDDLLAWYDTTHRKLPWRAPLGEISDPYRVWLSEIMLQQTTVKAVAPYYAKFLETWPTVKALAAADRDDVLTAWAGLGYYARARNLHACAQHVAQHYGGRFPDNERELLTLPGVGSYTAAAIAAIAFGKQAAVVDGNVERVLARYFAVTTPLPAAKKQLREHAEVIAPLQRPGDFAQAMMDLGATVCTPRSPSCMLCPIAQDCAGRINGLEAVLPYKAAKQEKPTRRGAAFFASRWDGAVLLRRRADKGLLGGMVEVPGTPWVEGGECADDDALSHAPVHGAWKRVPGEVRHTFTHFHLELAVFRANVPSDAEVRSAAQPDSCMWVPREELRGQALPSVMRKVVTHALDGRAD